MEPDFQYPGAKCKGTKIHKINESPYHLKYFCNISGFTMYIFACFSTQVCTNRGTVMLKEFTEQQICGGRLYDPETQICCNGMVHSKYDEVSGNLKVCCQPGVRAYINESQICCAGRVADIHPNVGR